MAVKRHNPIPPSPIKYENTGVFSWKGSQYKVIGFDIDSHQAIVKSITTGQYRNMTNKQIAVIADKNPAEVVATQNTATVPVVAHEHIPA